MLGSSSGAALAQVSGTVSLVSNYVYRGVSLSDGKPEAQLSLAYDNDSGWFGGLFGSSIDTPGSSALAIAYAGYAHRLASDVSWEAGLTETAYQQASGQDYTEGFIGLSSERLNARLYYSPSYLGQDAHSVYAEINGNTPLNADWRLIAHVGYLAFQNDQSTRLRNRFDTRLGIGTNRGDWNIQFAVVSLRETYYDYGYSHISDHYGGVLNLSYGF